MKSLNNVISIAKITKTRGLKGELQLYSLFSSPERFEDLEYILVDGGSCEVKRCQVKGDRLMVMLEGIEDIDAAQLLVGKDACLPIDEIPRYDDEYFDFELSQLRVIDDNQQELGSLTQIIHTGGKDVYEICSPQGQTWMIPATREFVPEIDLDEGYMLVRPIAGMLDGDDAL